MLTPENRTINSLWIGNSLSFQELLTLKSFVAKGHEFHLWVYEPLKTALPQGVILQDANEILSSESIFRYPKKNSNYYFKKILPYRIGELLGASIDWGHGSFAGFSDIFRYKLLYEKGGWWADMDMTCLKPFDFETPYFFRNHWSLKVVGNAMKCPPKSDLMLNCYQRAVKEITKENKDWHKPIQILNEEIDKLDLWQYRKLGLFNLDMLYTVLPYRREHHPFPKDWYGVHWLNSSKENSYKKGSAFYRLLHLYKII
jgi:hypothetical protein